VTLTLEPGERTQDTRTVPPERFTKRHIWIGALVFGLVCIGVLNYLAMPYWRGYTGGTVAAIALGVVSLTLIDAGHAAAKRFASRAPADSAQAAWVGAQLGVSYGFPRWLGAMLVAWGAGYFAGLDAARSNEYMILVRGGVAGLIVTFALGGALFSKLMESARGEDYTPPG
jgi:hypothetical protein